MSAFILEDKSFDSLYTSLKDTDYFQYCRYDGTLLQFVTKIREWNYKSVNFRYREVNEMPEYIPHNHTKLSKLALYKLIDCIDYQSCEDPAWYHSIEEKCLCRIQKMIADDFVTNNPEYTQAAWGH